MSGNRANEKEPQEEFVQEESTETQKETGAGSKQPKYENWNLKQLQHEAKKKEIADYEKLSKEELIKRLKNS